MKKELLLAGVSAFALMLAVSPASAQDGAFAEINPGPPAITIPDIVLPGTVGPGNVSSDPGTTRPNLVVDSFNGASGIAQMQQNEGSANSMNIATAVQVGLANAADVTASSLVNSHVIGNTTDQIGGTRTNDVTTSFNGGFAGVASVQQNNGDHNEMGIANAVQSQLTDATSSSADADANSAVDGGNMAFQNGGTRDNDVTDSFQGAAGVATVQQNNGSQNAMGVANSVQADLGDSTGTTDAMANVDSSVGGIIVKPSGNESSQNGGSRQNDVGVAPEGAFNGFNGVATVQQNNGDHNAMGVANAVQMGITPGGAATSMADAGVLLDSYDNSAIQSEGSRDNDVTSSFNEGATGVATVQQNNGDNNAMGVANAIQVGIANDGDVTTNASVEGNTYYNMSAQVGGTRENEVTDSFNDFNGVVAVQQNNGDNNTIGAATSLHGNLGGSGDLNQTTSVSGSTYDQSGVLNGLEGNPVRDIGSTRDNSIDPSFVGAEGIFTVQQNNGNANAIGAATTVANNIGGIHDGPDKDDLTQRVSVSGSISENTRVLDDGSERHNTINSGSFNESRGVVTVQQNNGDVNVMGVATAVNTNIGLDQGTQVQNDVSQAVEVSGEIANAISFENDRIDGPTTFTGQRGNEIDSSFNEGASGLASVQQNNGSQNIMGIGNALQANIDNVSGSLDGDDDVRRQDGSAAGGVVEGSAVTWATPVNDTTATPRHRENVISNSFVGYTGFASVQQNNGDNNVMGIANAIAMTVRGNDKIDNVDDSAASTTGTTDNNEARDGTLIPRRFPGRAGANRANTIHNDSFDGFQGMATVQQNNGDNNVINAANTVVANIENATDIGPVDTAAETVVNSATGSATVTNNTSNDHRFSDRINLIDGSFDEAAGIMTVQQNNGSNNVMGASTAVAADLNNTTVGFGPALSTASLGATVSGNTTVVIPNVQAPGRTNTIMNSFTGATGIMVVQQNNGDNNAMGSAVSVTANIPAGGFNGGSFMSGLQ